MIKLVWERWKKVPELPQIKVSSLGRVKINGKLITPKINHSGYFVIETEDRYYFVHRLVAKAFLKENLSQYETVDHLDSNRRNNAITNLEIVSRDENQYRATQKIVDTTFATCENVPKWTIRISDGVSEFRSLEKACNSLMNETDFTRPQAIKDILGALIFGYPATRAWSIVNKTDSNTTK